MKKIFYFLILILLVSCNFKSNTNRKKDSQSSEVVTKDEKVDEYLKTRDADIDTLQKLQKLQKPRGMQWPPINDTLSELENKALLDLEGKLKTILKNSNFSNRGEINLETLFRFENFGRLDGLVFKEDSLKVFYTSKKLFLAYFQEKKMDHLNDLTPKDLEEIFQSTYLSDAALKNFSWFKQSSNNSIVVYGMVGLPYQIVGPWLPDRIYSLVIKDDYIYMGEKRLGKKIYEIPKCRQIWDSLAAGDLLSEYAWNKYSECYQEEIKHDPQFESLQKQFNWIINYLENTINLSN